MTGASPGTPDRARPLFDPVVQVAYYVSDPEEAARVWAAERHAGPFFVRRHIPVTDVVYRGTPSRFDHTSAYGWWACPSRTNRPLCRYCASFRRR